jgi:hypothetical protein
MNASVPDRMKQLILKYKGYSWSCGSQYTAVFDDHDDVIVSCPMLLSTSWTLNNRQYKLRRPSNTGSILTVDETTGFGRIEEGCRNWNVSFDSLSYKLDLLKRGAVLKTNAALIATLVTNPIGRITCKCQAKKFHLLPLLLYVTIFYRLSLDANSC